MKYLKVIPFYIGLFLLFYASICSLLRELTRLQTIKEYWVIYIIAFGCVFVSLYLVDKDGK